MTDQREQALAAFDRIVTRAVAYAPAWQLDTEEHAALVRAALTPPPADLAVAAETAETLRTWFPDGEIPTSFQDAAVAIENMAAELAELRARPTLTAEQATAALGAIIHGSEWPRPEAVRAAQTALRAIAEGASS